MKLTKNYLKQVIKEELENEGFYGRRFGSRYVNPNGGYSRGGGYGDDEEESGYHARPGEEFKVPGQAKLFFKTVGEDGKTEAYARTINYNSQRHLDMKVEEAYGDIQQKYAPKKVEFGELKVISKPHTVEN